MHVCSANPPKIEKTEKASGLGGGTVILKGDGKIGLIYVTDIVLEVAVTWTVLSTTEFHWHGLKNRKRQQF